MKLRVDRDSDDILKFYIVPVNRAKIAALLVGGIYQGLRSGSAGPDSALDTKKEVAGAVVNAFKETVAYAWLLENAPGKANWGGSFSVEAGMIPMPRIYVTFTERKVAGQFKLMFGGTIISAAHKAEEV